MLNPQVGKYLIFIGIALVLLGAVVYLAGNKLQWFGHLPGDIRIEKENFKLFFPVTSMVLVSLLLNLVIYLVRKIM